MMKGKKSNPRNIKLGVSLALLGCVSLTGLLYMYGGEEPPVQSVVLTTNLQETVVTTEKTPKDAGELPNVEAELRARYIERKGTFPEGSGLQSSTCSHQLPPYRLSLSGRKCIFPFQVGGVWRTNCDLGVCAVKVDALSRAIEMANCSSSTYIRGPLKCTHISDTSNCRGPGGADASPCSHLLGGKAIAGICHCSGTFNGQQYTVNKHIGCETAMVATCSEICATLEENSMSAAHSASKLSEEPDVITRLAEIANTYKPASSTDLTAWNAYADVAQELQNYTSQWCGKGIAIMAGSVNTLPQALATVSFLRDHLRSTIPVEIWQTKEEESNHSHDFLRALTQLSVSIRSLPQAAKSERSHEMFALKPAVVLASSFDTVLLLDADSIPLVDPAQLMDMRTPNVSAVFWPDFWTLLWDANIWSAVGGWPFGEQRNVASQDSGLMVVCKSCGGWKPLALAFYFNYYSDVYYYAIYNGHWQEQMCRDGNCVLGHDVPGAGDKDTFQVAWLALNEPYTMLIPASICGAMLPKRNLVCGSSFIHRNHLHEGIALHHNSNKWWWGDFIAGRWTHWRTGLHLKHVSSFMNHSEAYFADGMNDWRSVTYSTRGDAGKQNPPPGARWCLIYRGQVRTQRLTEDLGWDIEQVLVEYYTKLYSTPWMVEWATLQSGASGLASCVKGLKWATEKWLKTASDEDVRNTAISHMTDLGLGSVPYLQSHSDASLVRMCRGVALTPVPHSEERREES
eukprot:TRINITY_DN152_c0_g3_i2.p1 TRINITY_DN152_c0_g3~~TRINITY_DN152_c0_g3_i2.p1  ORF type:complete len:740 (+),score=211.98 TRINITY_DN152_c0_g3_i2:618-2837(+)